MILKEQRFRGLFDFLQSVAQSIQLGKAEWAFRCTHSYSKCILSLISLKEVKPCEEDAFPRMKDTAQS
jgi:hypothetical protein